MFFKENSHSVSQYDFYGKWLFMGQSIDFEFDVLLTITSDYFSMEYTDGGYYKVGKLNWIENNNYLDDHFSVGYDIIGKYEECNLYFPFIIGDNCGKTFYLNKNKNILEDCGIIYFHVNEKIELKILTDEELEIINERRYSLNLSLFNRNKKLVKNNEVNAPVKTFQNGSQNKP